MTPLLRRSELAVPAPNDHMFAKALSCGADLVFLDLEDAVPPAFKEESREKAIAALTGLDWGTAGRAVRINGLDTKWHCQLEQSEGDFAGSPPRFTRSRVTYEAYVVSGTSTRPQVDSATNRATRALLMSQRGRLHRWRL
jgi:HpcH/HpaI aldolase/citrate lyase family